MAATAKGQLLRVIQADLVVAAAAPSVGQMLADLEHLGKGLRAAQPIRLVETLRVAAAAQAQLAGIVVLVCPALAAQE